ncbi:MAG TPA: MarR family transcriptional regulator [Methylomusa anaerophila]|uniref:Putative HTH-type transcriptional regulator/GBAA_1941/BAS1801 n=1 Tax=Methylomusa anaerophila TaxID=1930071 RepID=A0A348AM52_9FIRM|nr:MarR family transcriptional regulator [Methylomusa anaerophila]BBB92150.1 putative HTH-type transcriptional regulator/GBAA_1941/BAS1801 [Methylomusa anaerophila]HML87836.1 MarR family transcriptional regulator [Methylomusa anaerophila]
MPVVDEFTHELFIFFNGFASWENSVIRAGNLTVAEAHAVEILGTYGPINMKNLAQKLGVTTGTTTVTVDRLEKEGYAQRESVKEDRRVYLITLTDKGKKAFAEHHKYHNTLTEQVLSILSAEESAQMLAILKKVNAEIF